MSKLTKRHGEDRAREVVSARHLFIFPNVYLFDDLVRIVQPISLEETEIYSHPFRLGGVPEEFNARRLYEVTRQLSTTGMVNPADLEMFAANQTGLHARHGLVGVVPGHRDGGSQAIGRARGTAFRRDAATGLLPDLAASDVPVCF